MSRDAQKNIQEYNFWKLTLPESGSAILEIKRPGMEKFADLSREELLELREVMQEKGTVQYQILDFPLRLLAVMQVPEIGLRQYFYFVRHGETEWNKRAKALGHLDISINESGKSQALELKEELKEMPFDALVSSDLKRAFDTATIVNEEHRVTIETDPRLRARDWGELTGKASTLLYATNPELFACVESSEKIQERVFHFLNEFVKSHPQRENVCVVCHGSVIRVILAKLLGFAFANRKFIVRNTAILKISCYKGNWKLEETHDIELPNTLIFL